MRMAATNREDRKSTFPKSPGKRLDGYGGLPGLRGDETHAGRANKLN
jgi:hypothetical protein